MINGMMLGGSHKNTSNLLPEIMSFDAWLDVSGRFFVCKQNPYPSNEHMGSISIPEIASITAHMDTKELEIELYALPKFKRIMLSLNNGEGRSECSYQQRVFINGKSCYRYTGIVDNTLLRIWNLSLNEGVVYTHALTGYWR